MNEPVKNNGCLDSVRPTVPLLAAAAILLLARPAQAQLAITEMMSFSQTEVGSTNLVKNSDYWELTNFGSNDVNITGYKFSDISNTPQTLVKNSNPMIVHAGESVIFVRDNVFTNQAQVRAWWGACLASNVQVRFYNKPGFSSCGDGIRLYDLSMNVVDAVNFAGAIPGRSFVYDTNSGAFGTLSTPGDGVSCRAPTADNYGSPGRTAGPIPLRIAEQPASAIVCADQLVTFSVAAVGMPHPHYQWYFNGAALPYTDQSSYTVIANPSTVGRYSVRVSNAFRTIDSSNAVLSIDTNLAAPTFLTRMADLSVTTNRPARFSASVCAFPAASYQWFSNGVVLPGETFNTLHLPRCTLAMSGTEYCVRVTNALGTNFACARLTVTVKPDLRFTEIQAYPFTACDAHHDWFEVTNFGSNTVNLLGYRFFDNPHLSGARIVTQSMIVKPKESVVFVKTDSAALFIDWWGADQLPPGFQIFPYCGFSLGKDGDALYLWSAEAENDDEFLDSISFASNAEGVSIRFDQDNCFFGCDSVAGEAGAFRSAQCGDVGSPGYIANPPPRVVSLARCPVGMRLKWRAVEGSSYRVEYAETPQADRWRWLQTMTATNGLPVMEDPASAGTAMRFYRVGELPP